jgi:hypothetical protein
MSVPPYSRKKTALESLPERVIDSVDLWKEIADRVELTSICLGYPKGICLPPDVDVWDWEENEASGTIEYSAKMNGRVYSKIQSLPDNLHDIVQPMQKFMAARDASVTKLCRLTVTIFKGKKKLTEFAFQKSR